MDSRYDLRFFTVRVSPFGNLRIEAYLQLPAAYRSLSRPSSALCAKAFTLCSSSLELPLLSSSSELSEFHLTNNFGCQFNREKVLSFLALNRFPPFGEIVIITQIGKTF